MSQKFESDNNLTERNIRIIQGNIPLKRPLIQPKKI